MAWTSTASTELDLPNGAKIYEGTFDAICGNFGHIGGTTGLDWIDWTPTVNQGGAVAVTVNRAKYCKIHNTGFLQALMTVTGAGTSGNSILLQGIPAAVAPVSSTIPYRPVGNALVTDISAGGIYHGAVYIPTSATTRLQIFTDGAGGGFPLGAGAFSLGSSDVIGFEATIETSG